MPATTTTVCDCPKCSGTGKLPHFSHIFGGECFTCKGGGKITIRSFIGENRDVLLQVYKKNGEFWYASLECRTWKNVPDQDGVVWHIWGDNLWSKELTIDEARSVWRTAKSEGIKTSIWED